MIQTKMEIVYGDRSEKMGIVKVEVRPLGVTPDGERFLVIDWDVTNNSVIFSKEVFWTKEQINNMDVLLESTNDFSELTKLEKEMLKIKLALMYDTQNNVFPSGKTIYRRDPEDWEFTPEPVEPVIEEPEPIEPFDPSIFN